MKRFFVTGIGTEIGKTVVSSILVEALESDYWKPIQAGELESTDSEKVKELISNSKTKIHTEQFLLKTPASPHESAELEDKSISLSDLKIPRTKNTLFIEGAGGIMVPINYNGDTFLDFVKQNKLPVVVVIPFYLGSINHSLLTLEILMWHNVKIVGVIFNGQQNKASKEIILSKTQIKKYVKIPKIEDINQKSIYNMASKIKHINDWF